MDLEDNETDTRDSQEVTWARHKKTNDEQSSQAHISAYCMATLVRDETDLDKEELCEMCFNGETTSKPTERLEDSELEGFPMNPKILAKAQRLDKELRKKVEKSKQEYSKKDIEGHTLICYNEKILVPKVLQNRIVAWVHHYLVHPGETRMEKTIGQILTWPKMRDDIRRFVKSCRKCQLCKSAAKKYGHLPAKEAEPSVPWNRVNVDLVERPSADCCQKALDDAWINMYPRPHYIGFDNGKEFKSVFEELVENYGLTKKPSSPYNPQANGIVERVHQVLGNMLRTFELEEEELDGHDPWSSFLSAAAYAIRSTYHTTLEATPAELIFGRNMLLPVQFKADWEAIRARRQAMINKNNERENSKRIAHTYSIGDMVSKARPGILRKLRRKRDGPFTVTHVYTNGTIRIRQGAISERINIRRVQPFSEPETPEA
ncbi:Retrotransposon protein [Seminavis robusta]|uniref:Retrotransposon protein n=1 Tax=Seminavis robusta TaxID=568900 RepID=A0A9N8DY79_9STRA|nr:Retrotransposon protein [Seminavis robusta]|eukprot:Sro440_g143450.1 Retrotransposon protein (432) ;mRNA; f:29966-31363